jgi:hypothetical protein
MGCTAAEDVRGGAAVLCWAGGILGGDLRRRAAIVLRVRLSSERNEPSVRVGENSACRGQEGATG